MPSHTIAWPLSAMLLMLSAGCASSPPACPSLPDAPAEMMTPAPSQGYFLTTLETILSRSPGQPTK